jgi:hypothetical protein
VSTPEMTPALEHFRPDDGHQSISTPPPLQITLGTALVCHDSQLIPSICDWREVDAGRTNYVTRECPRRRRVLGEATFPERPLR